MTSRRAALQTLAEQAASKIGFTLRRWWQDATNPAVLRVEVERRMIGAPPAIGELMVAVPDASPQQHTQSPPISTQSRKLRRHPSAKVSSSRQQTARPQKRKASATTEKEHPRTQRKTTKAKAPGRERSSARAAASAGHASARKRRK